MKGFVAVLIAGGITRRSEVVTQGRRRSIGMAINMKKTDVMKVCDEIQMIEHHNGQMIASKGDSSPTPSPGWGPRGQGPSKNRQAPGKIAGLFVLKWKKTKWQPCVVFHGGWSRRLSHTHSYPGCHAPDCLCTTVPRLQSVY